MRDLNTVELKQVAGGNGTTSNEQNGSISTAQANINSIVGQIPSNATKYKLDLSGTAGNHGHPNTLTATGSYTPAPNISIQASGTISDKGTKTATATVSIAG